jgi:hypothetical protein
LDDKKKPEQKKPEQNKPQPETEKRSPGVQPNEGEGNKTADKQYREHVREFEEQHDTESLGRSAKRDIERDPAGYRAAEDEGRRHIAEEDPDLYKKGEKKE